jgi:hypothetical protein
MTCRLWLFLAGLELEIARGHAACSGCFCFEASRGCKDLCCHLVLFSACVQHANHLWHFIYVYIVIYIYYIIYHIYIFTFSYGIWMYSAFAMKIKSQACSMYLDLDIVPSSLSVDRMCWAIYPFPWGWICWAGACWPVDPWEGSAVGWTCLNSYVQIQTQQNVAELVPV